MSSTKFLSPIKIFVDTNVLYHALDYGINIEEGIKGIIDREFGIYLHPKVEGEIIADLTKNGKISRQAKLAIQLSSDFNSYPDSTEYPGTDTAILKSAKKENGIVFTFDKELRNRCKIADVPVITHYIRGKLQLIGHIR